MSIFGALLGGGGSGVIGTAAKSVTGGGVNWGSLAGTAASAAGSGWLSNLFGGGGSSGSNSLFQGILGGLGAAADAYMGEKAQREKGRQERQTIGYAAELEDFYQQKNKARKRAALDTYGQFSLMSRYAPTASRMVPLDQPAKPGLG